MIRQFFWVHIDPESQSFYDGIRYVSCQKAPLRTWREPENWVVQDPIERVVVFEYQVRIMFDLRSNRLALTSEEHFKKICPSQVIFARDWTGEWKHEPYNHSPLRFENPLQEEPELDWFCKIPDFSDFITARNYIAEKFGYRKENILELSGEETRKYHLGEIRI